MYTSRSNREPKKDKITSWKSFASQNVHRYSMFMDLDLPGDNLCNDWSLKLEKTSTASVMVETEFSRFKPKCNNAKFYSFFEMAKSDDNFLKMSTMREVNPVVSLSLMVISGGRQLLALLHPPCSCAVHFFFFWGPSGILKLNRERGIKIQAFRVRNNFS